MSTPRPKRAAAARPGAPDAARAALESTRKELEALAASDLVAVNTDVPGAVSIALGALAHLRTLRAQIAEELPKHPVHYLDRLEVIALAAWYAHLRTLPTEDSADAVEKLLADASPLRKNLLVAAEALAHYELVSQSTVDVIRAGQGNLDTANDLVALGALLREAWPRIHDKTPVTEGDVDRASLLGPQLIAALGMRDHPVPLERDEPALTRTRAFSLLVKAYKECRAASLYLRRDEEDPDALTPSLFQRAPRNRKSEREEQPAGPAKPPADPIKPPA